MPTIPHQLPHQAPPIEPSTSVPSPSTTAGLGLSPGELCEPDGYDEHDDDTDISLKAPAALAALPRHADPAPPTSVPPSTASRALAAPMQ